MTNQNETQGKFLINCQDGANNVERATISCILAVTASKTSETAMFVSAEAAQLCVKGGTDGMIAEGYEPVAGLLADFVDNGGKIWLCPACAKAKGITESDLITGVEIAGAPKSMAFLASGAHLLA
ncbi:MAG: DsrE family protein [Pseudomonadales bacterium]